MDEFIEHLVKRMDKLETKLETHLEESGYIKSNLKFNTWLTCVIASAILTYTINAIIKR